MSTPTSKPSLQVPPKPQAASLLTRLQNHLRMMAPHQRDRYAGKLLIEATHELSKLAALLSRCLPIVEADARMMADITRHAPLDTESQTKHDSTEYESERLMREIPAALGLPNAKDEPRRPL